MSRSVDWRLYVVLDMGILEERDPLGVARAVVRGGATVLQFRAKTWSVRRVVELAQALLAVAEDGDVPLIINDHVDVALAVGAAGVHLGVDDLPVRMARRLMPHGLIGYSPEGAEDAQRAVQEGVDYLGVGPFAATSTKSDAGAQIGAVGLSAMVAAGSVPVVAVGGLTQAHLPAAFGTGAAGVALASAVILSPDPEQMTRQLRAIVDSMPSGSLHLK